MAILPTSFFKLRTNGSFEQLDKIETELGNKGMLTDALGRVWGVEKTFKAGESVGWGDYLQVDTFSWWNGLVSVNREV